MGGVRRGVWVRWKGGWYEIGHQRVVVWDGRNGTWMRLDALLNQACLDTNLSMSKGAGSGGLVNDSCHAFVLRVHANDSSNVFVVVFASADETPHKSFAMCGVITRVSAGSKSEVKRDMG